MNAHKINGVPRTGASATEGGLETVVENSVVLDGSAMNQIINIDNENKIQIKNHEVFMIKATCPDHLCIKQGKINKKGATIVCLPHHLVVEVIEGNEGKEDGKVY